MVSIFSRYYSFLGNKYPELTDGLTIHRLTHEVRGRQVAEFLGAKFNPKEGYENDVIIHIKPRNLLKVKDGEWVDMGDGQHLIEEFKLRPKVKVIIISDYAYECYKDILPNEMVVIPHHHVNWERATREKNNPIVGGYIGRPSPIAININNRLKEILKKVGVDFISCYNWTCRQDAVDFYKSIDFIIIGATDDLDITCPVQTPTKMINAAAFGVPSIAYFRKGYKEFEGYYTPFTFKNIDDLLHEVQRLKDKNYYDCQACRLIEKAEEYHISKIIERYKVLS